MTAENSNDQQQAPEQYPGLKNLNKLVGTWKVSGSEIEGQVTFEWLEGGFFLVQHFNLEHHGHKIKGIEIIGYERGFGAESPSENMKSRAYDNVGNTFDYTYEVDDEFLTIWGGEKGSRPITRVSGAKTQILTPALGYILEVDTTQP
jgi:hypothetical protein